MRATRKVGAGAPLTVSLLPSAGGGPDAGLGALSASGAATLLSPLAERRAALADLRGFVCRCRRCRDEEALVRRRAASGSGGGGVVAGRNARFCGRHRR